MASENAVSDSADHITHLRISGLRTIARLELELTGLTVLIGDNGTGKSSILEALEILRQSAAVLEHVPDIVTRKHGGLPALLRRGSTELRLGVSVEGDGPRLDYDCAFGMIGNTPAVFSEVVNLHPDVETGGEPRPLLRRSGTKAEIFDAPPRQGGGTTTVTPVGVQVGEDRLALPTAAFKGHPALQRLVDALARIDVHVPFETRPLWQCRELGLVEGARRPTMLEAAKRLSRYAVNLPNAFHELRDEGGEAWERVLGRAKLGLGGDLRDFKFPKSGRGSIELAVVFGASPDQAFTMDALSEGQLSYLAFVALCEPLSPRSVLAIDEPELHLHPGLQARVLWMLEEASRQAPVILATHSSHLLDALEDPARSVVLCELEEDRSVTFHRPNAERLEEWLERYDGIGSVRAAGYEAQVFDGGADGSVKSP